MSEVRQPSMQERIVQSARDNVWLIAAILVGLLVRLVPILLWGDLDCTRDECIYKGMGERILAGEGLTVSKKAG